MFQRLLVLALFAVIVIMLFRTVMHWLNRSGRIGRDQTEIKGNWEIVNPLGKLGKSARKAIKTSLVLPDEDQLQKVAGLLDVVHRAVNGFAIDSGELRNLAEQASATIRAGLYHEEAVHATGWLLYAIDCAQAVRPHLNAYELKRQTLAVYREIFPKDPEIVLPPERTLVSVSHDAPPVADDRYVHLSKLGTKYIEDEIYAALLKQTPGSLPDGAMLPLLELLYATENDPEPNYGTPVEVLLADYGERLYATVAYCMIKWEPQKRKRATMYSSTLFQIIGTWSQASSELLFRAALESGWNDCARFLPDSGWAQKLTAAYKDSPYGALM